MLNTCHQFRGNFSLADAYNIYIYNIYFYNVNLTQEPGSCEDIQRFAKEKKANFTMFDKCDVKGDNISPVFAFLSQMSGKVSDPYKHEHKLT